MRQLFISIAILSTYYLSAQKTITISKSEILKSVHKNNQSLKINSKETQIANADYQQSNTIFLPNISVSHTGTYTTNPLMAFGSKLNQEILTQSDFNPTLLNNPNGTRNFTTKIEIQQPIINVDGFLKRRAAKMKIQATILKEKRTKTYLDFEINKTYMLLQLTYKVVEVLEKTLKTANANKELAINNLEQGYLQKSDVLEAEIRVTEIKNQLSSQKSNIQNISNYLSFLMNKNENIIYKPIDELSLEKLNTETTILEKNRSDIKAMKLVSKAYEIMNKAEKMSFLPRLNAFGTYELYDDKIFQGNANGYLIGVQLKWDIFQGSQRLGKLQKSKALFEKSKLEYEKYVSKSQIELNKAKRMLLDASHKLKLIDLAVKQSKEALRIRKNRFQEGLEKSTDLLTSETTYAQKQLEYYQTIFEYNYAKSYVQFLSK